MLFNCYTNITLGQIVITRNDGTVYKIRTGTRIDYQLKGDSLIRTSRIKKLGNGLSRQRSPLERDQSVLMKNDQRFDVNQLTYIKFRPKKIKRAVWVTGLGMMGGTGITCMIYDASRPQKSSLFSATGLYITLLPVAVPTLLLIAEITDISFSKRKEIYLSDSSVSIRVY
jgi:hypothetical protein